MGTNWGPTSSFLIKKEYFSSEAYVGKPYKIGFENKTSVRIRNASPRWQRRGQGFEPPWLHKYDCLAKAFEAFVFFVLKPSAVDKSQAV
ncbi:hypothetical protein [Bacillus atrophaeus]|uniref:hypothetical protein n=1 Tax=Bacillus atrophaeus TaxID=1452 RepID=UPI00227E3086|nr:hypothetical protein [Bacillus atrophaeus]MCY8921887.1 hypothetical protein [Bacillus atrophaeus]MED4857170.1 hypothetical protein [Bacillus atrophaeus]